jgi:hypothetical protein
VLYIPCEDLSLYYVQCDGCGAQGPYTPDKKCAEEFWDTLQCFGTLSVGTDMKCFTPIKVEDCEPASLYSVACDFPAISFGPNFEISSDYTVNLLYDSSGHIIAVEPGDAEDENQR